MIRGQIDLLRTNELSHPAVNKDLPRIGVLVLTGRLTGAAPLEVQDYQRQVAERGETPLEVWGRERLIELFSASPDAGLAGLSEGPLLELVARIESAEITEIELERYSVRWIRDGRPLDWKSVLEAGIIANRLRQAERLDLACFTSLALLRGVWASAHSAREQPEATLEAQAVLVRDLFESHAAELWARCGPSELDPRELIASDDEGVFLTYPVRCLRLMEMLGMYGLLLEPGEQRALAEWLAQFLERQPGAAHPVSERWAVSMLPALLLARKADAAGVGRYLERVVTWLGDTHQGEAAGLASYHADSKEEADFLLGGSLEHVPLNTSPKYAESADAGDGWRAAAHHDDDLSRYLLGRAGHLWDALSLSIVTRDRHWVALLRAL